MALEKEAVIWLSVHVIIFFLIFFTPGQMGCLYCPVLGGTLIVLGALIWAFAKHEMGRVEIGIKADKFVSTGIYSKLRHPLYLGVKMMYLGFAIAFESVLGLALVILVLIPFHVYRARNEERELTKRFGKRYTDYIKRTLL